MKNYKPKKVPTLMVQKVLDSVTCDVCGRTFRYADASAKDDLLEIEELVHIEHNCGYGSIIEDQYFYDLDICQHCVKERLGDKLRIYDELGKEVN